MKNKATLKLENKEYELDLLTGTYGDRALDITKLMKDTNMITLDPGYVNTGSCESKISYVDGDNGVLRYRGYDIAELSVKSTFVEVAYLLIYGELPTEEQLKNFRQSIRKHAIIHEDMKNFFNLYPGQAHPMAVLSALVCSLSVYHPELLKPDQNEQERDETICTLLSKVRVLTAFAYRRHKGLPFVYPKEELNYVENFAYMMFSDPMVEYSNDSIIVNAIDLLLILHADHEQNCSASTVRMVGSSKANLFASISAGINALWGPLHGGANQAVIEMLEMIKNDGGDYKKYITKAKDKNDSFRLMGFGHRIYKNYDPRANIIKKACDDILNKLGIDDPILDIAKELEHIALSDNYFVERKLYPNVDFYSGIIYKALGIPTNMFTVMFALGRLPGWIAQWKELIEDPEMKIYRPRQLYTGAPLRDYIPITARK